MHRLPSKSAINRIRLASLLVCAKCLLAPAAALLLIYSFLKSDIKLTYLAVGLALLCSLVAFLQWLVAARTNCPLCITPVLASRRCTKHRNARPALGSHRLRVALSVLFTNSFRCPYCGEPSVLEVRERNRNRQHAYASRSH